jgi:AraC-like DNA-binding protein
VSRFEEFPAPHRLGRYVDSVWTSRQDAGGPSRILPDGCVEIVVALAGGFMPYTTTIVPLATRPIATNYAPHSHLVGVRLTAAGAVRLLAGALPCINTTADASAVAPRLTSELECAADAFARGESIAAVYVAMETAISRTTPMDARLERVCALLQRAPHMTVSSIATDAGMSTRQLDRCFDRAVGISPKLLARLVRFQRAFAAGAAAQRGDWASIAARGGYADQSHLCREFATFCGESPEGLRRSFAPQAMSDLSKIR